MTETASAFAAPEMYSGDLGFFDFLKHALFDYREEREGDTLRITGRVGRQQTVAEVGNRVIDRFKDLEEADKATIIPGEHGLIVMFTEPMNGIRQIEFSILEAE